MTDQRATCSLILCPILFTLSTRQCRGSVGLTSLLELGSFSANNTIKCYHNTLTIISITETECVVLAPQQVSSISINIVIINMCVAIRIRRMLMAYADNDIRKLIRNRNLVTYACTPAYGTLLEH
jgi:hypothetical protein